MTTIRVALPAHLRNLAQVASEVSVEVAGEPTISLVLDALEAAHPQLRGTIRDQASKERRAFMRYFACGQDVSLASPDLPLSDEVVAGREPLRIVGAIAGG